MAEKEEYVGLLRSAFKRVFNREARPFEFDDRLALQKIAYYLKTKGLAFQNEQFGWYLRGPYSGGVALATYYFSNKPDEKPMTPQQAQALDTLKAFITTNGTPSVDLLELYGSIEFLRVDRHIPTEELANQLLSRKAWYHREEVEKAVHDLTTTT